MGEKRRTIKIIGLSVIFLAILIIPLLLLFFNKHETHISDKGENKIVTALDCTTRSIDEAFFTSEIANTITNQIKITFNQNKIDKLFYSFEGIYRSKEIAEQDETNLHARYNIHMGKYGINPEILTPTFSTVNTKMRINLYAKNREIISRGVGLLFFINDEDINNFLEYSKDQVTNFYKEKGFSCDEKN